MRPAIAVLALLVAAAGCAGFGLPAPTPSPTPTPTPARAAGTPIGLTAAGVTDPLALRAAHVDARGRLDSYAGRRELVVRAPDGTRRGSVVRRVRAGEGGRRFSSARTVTGALPPRFAATPASRSFSDGKVTVVPITFGSDVETLAWPAAQAPIQGPPVLLDWRVVQRVFEALSTSVVGVETRDGTTVYVVRGGPGTVPALDATNATVTARIARSGLVYLFRVRYWTAGPSGPYRVTRRVRYGGVNATTVPRPAWVDPALSNATTPSGDG